MIFTTTKPWPVETPRLVTLEENHGAVTVLIDGKIVAWIGGTNFTDQIAVNVDAIKTFSKFPSTIFDLR